MQTLNLTIQVTLKDEELVTADEKEAFIKQLLQDQCVAVSNTYSFGVAVEGSLTSSLTDAVEIDEAKPDWSS